MTPQHGTKRRAEKCTTTLHRDEKLYVSRFMWACVIDVLSFTDNVSSSRSWDVERSV